MLKFYSISNRSKNILRKFAGHMKKLHSGRKPDCNIEEMVPLIEEIEAIQKNHLNLALHNERLATTAQLAAGLAHDIRNPLTSVRGFLQLLSTRVTEKDREMIDISLEELDGINNLITEMLYLARPPKSNFVRTGLEPLISNIKALIAPEANLKEIILKTSVEAELPDVLIDPEQMKQVLSNLLRNSFEAVGEKGEVLISVYSAADYIGIEIKDNGKGIPEEEKEKVFDAIYTTKNNGIGLGLPICREIIAQHDGKLLLDSEVGTGTVVKILLPFKDCGHEPGDESSDTLNIRHKGAGTGEANNRNGMLKDDMVWN